MRRARWSLAVVLGVALALVAVQLRVQANPTGQWVVDDMRGDLASLTLGMHSPNHSWESENDIPIVQLTGLSTSALRSAGADVHFVLHRAAGDFVCDGHASQGVAAGTFIFNANPAYGPALAAQGLAMPDADEQLELAAADVTPELVGQYRAAGLRPDLPGLLELVHRGISPDFVFAMTHSGMTGLSIADIVQLHDHGVRPELITAVKSAGLALDAQGLVRMADHGVTPGYISAMRALGYTPTADEYVRLEDHGVTSSWVRQVQAAGLKPSVEDLIRLRDAGV